MDSNEREVFAVVMAGGSGTRFWPASRRALPKQFLRVAGERSLLAETCARLEGLVPPDRIVVVTLAEHVERARAELPELPRENVLGEPMGRNTLPCAALASAWIRARAPGALQVVLPADHVIAPAQAFRASLAQALEAAAAGDTIVTLGIVPTFAATGYGYIEAGASVRNGLRDVQAFHEKPDSAQAESYVAGEAHFWNAGIFVWTQAAFERELERQAPELARAFAPELLEANHAGDLARTYAALASTSIDTGIMEHAERALVLPIDYAWSDVGSWTALPDVLPADGDGHVAAAGTRVVSVDAQDCIVHGEEGTLTALVGVRDLIVVRAGDALLICPKDRAQDVRRLVEELERRDDPAR